MDKTIIGSISSEDTPSEQLTPYLRIQSPNDLVFHVQLSKDAITLGRGDNCDVVLNDYLASRKHCKIWLDSEGKINVHDLNSTNGSKIDGFNIKQGVLLPQQRLTIGLHIIKVEYKDAAEVHHEALLQTAATCDPLTGVSNRKWFEERATQIFRTIAGKDQYIAIVMVDIDHFKFVNDNFGHQVGDVVIKGVAEILNSCKRQHDLVARYGGEEFILCLTDSSPESTELFCERVRQKIAGSVFCFAEEQLSVTVSLGGCSNIIDTNSNLYDMTAYADKALYRSKDSGRNTTTITYEKNVLGVS